MVKNTQLFQKALISQFLPTRQRFLLKKKEKNEQQSIPLQPVDILTFISQKRNNVVQF